MSEADWIVEEVSGVTVEESFIELWKDENNNTEMASTSTPVKSSAFTGTEFVEMAPEITLLSPVLGAPQVDILSAVLEAPQHHNEIRPEVPFTEAPPVNEVRPEVPLAVQNPVAEASQANQVTPVDLSTKNFLKASKNNNKMKTKALRSCTNCRYTTYDKANLARHHRRKHGNIKIVCSQCHKTFKDPYEKNQHVRSIHQGIKLICEVCSKAFNTRQNLRRHKLIEHSNLAPYSCHMCCKRFIEKRAYYGHLNKHMNVKPYNCAICKLEFGYKYSLDRHMASCANKDSLKCSICLRLFKTIASLKEHQKGVHGPKIHHCPCDKSFSWKSALCRHKKNCKVA